MKEVKIEESWKMALKEEFEKPYFSALISFIKEEKEAGKIIYPPGPQIFNAFDFTPINDVKVVILGQDPYHGPNQAHGLCFSVNDGIPPPPSLQNIFKELQTDIPGFVIPRTGNLTHWAKQGVLLINATLTVRASEAGSHQKKGWEIFTDAVIKKVSEQNPHCVFILWGAYARSKSALIDKNKHLLVESVHPSPLSAYNGFWGSKPFSQTNNWLLDKNLEPINW